MGDEEESIFRDKSEDVDWQLVLQKREDGLLDRLVEADRASDGDALKKLVDEAEGLFAKLAKFRVDKDDSKAADVDNLIYLFQASQTVMEIKNYKLEAEEEAHKETRDKVKKLREEAKEMRERIKEQDNEVEELQAEMSALLGATTPGKDKGLDPVAQRRMDAELNSTNKKLEAAQEELTVTKRALEREKEKSTEIEFKAKKIDDENALLKQELENLQKEMENLQRRTADEEKRQQKIRAQAQKTTKEAYKFVKEISELSRKNDELETDLKNKEEELQAMTNDNLQLREELTERTSELDNTAQLKDELEQEVASLREKVTELTIREDEREEEHEVFMQDITKRVRSLKEESAQKSVDLESANRDLREAKATIELLEEEKKASEVERRVQELQTQITMLHEEKAETLEQYIQMQRENKSLKQQITKLEADEKKLTKKLQVHYKARENEVRAGFFERQEEMSEAERRNTEMANHMAELQDQTMELEQHITQLENGTFGLSEAMDRVKELKRDVETGNNKISIRTKELNEALRKIEDLHEEVRLLRDHLRRTDPELKYIAQTVGFNLVSDADKNSELEWSGLKDGFRLDISGYKVKTAMELEKSKAMILQLEREVEALETERLEMKAQLRLLSLQRGERAAKLGMSASDIEKLDSYAEQLKSGVSQPFVDSGSGVGDKNRFRKVQERVDKLEKLLKDKDKELGTALETIDKLKDDIRASTGVRDAIDDLKRMQEGMSANYQAQMYMQQRPGTGKSEPGDGWAPSAAAPYNPVSMPLGPNFMDQIARAMREGDLGEQASVEVTVVSCRNLPVTNSYVVASIEKDHKMTAKIAGTTAPQFNETMHVAVHQRRTDVLVVKVYETASDGRKDQAPERLTGRVEIPVASFGKSVADQTWTGSRSAIIDLEDAAGVPVLKPGTRQRASVELKLKFVEAASKRAQILEGQLDALRQLQSVTNERLDAKDSEVDSLRSDLERKSQDLDHVLAERNKMREELQRMRMNSGFPMAAMMSPMSPFGGAMAGIGMQFGAPSSVLSAGTPSPMMGPGSGAQAVGGMEAQQDLAQAYSSALQQMGDLNAFMIQALDDLSRREDELKAVQAECAAYKEDFGVLRVQQVLLYKEHMAQVTELERDKAKLVKQWGDEKHRADVEAGKASAALARLDTIGSSTPETLQQQLAEAESRSILLQADQDVFERIVKTKREEEQELRSRYDALVIDMARQEHRLKERIGRLDRGRRAAENRLADCQRTLVSSVPAEELNRLRQDYLLLKEKHSSIMNEESRALLERATVEGHKQRAVKLAKENEDLRLQLAEASDRANALGKVLDGMATKEGATAEQQQLAALSAKLVKLEVSERNAARRAELSLDRMRGAEKDMHRLQERITSLEEENVETVARKHELEESDRELRARLEGCVSAETADGLRTQLSKVESEVTELQITATRHQEVADLATDQAKAMEELHAIHREELEALRAFLSQVQSESDEQAELGVLHGKLLDRQRQIHELTSKVAGMDRELVRMDDYVVRLEDALERKNEQLFDSQEQSSEKVKRLERTVEDFKAKAAGQIPLEKADQWAASLRDLTEQKHSALEDLSAARKLMQDSEERAETLQIRFDDQQVLVKALKEEIATQRGSGGEASVDRIVAQVGDATKLKVENLRFGRRLKQLQEREAFLDHNCQQLEREIRKLEEQLVQVQSESEMRAQESADSQIAQLKQKIQELEGVLSTTTRTGVARTPVKPGSKDLGSYASPMFAQMEAKTMDYQAIVAMKDEVERLSQLLQEKEAEIESLNKELDAQAASGGKAARRTTAEGVESGANEAAQHTEEVARLTIERLEKNNKRKNDLVQKYQEQIRQAREEYMAQKELDNDTIENLREQLAKKTQETIHNLRSRVQQHAFTPSLSGAAAADADAVFAEKDALIQALNGELQAMKGQMQDLETKAGELEGKVREKESEAEALSAELRKAEERKPSQVLETLVFRLRRQLADKERKQSDMKNAIESLRNEMLKAAEGQAVQQAAAMQALAAPSSAETDAGVTEAAGKMKAQIDALETKLTAQKGALTKLKKELEEERTAKLAVVKDKEGLEDKLRRQGLDLKKAQRVAKEATDSAKAAEETAQGDSKRIQELERRVREAERKGGVVPAGARRGEDSRTGEREEATSRWEAEKRLEAKVDRLSNKLREQRKELEGIEKQRDADREKADKDADRLRHRIEQLEEDKKQLKARLRGEGDQVDSEEVLARVRDAEKRVRDLEEENERLRAQIEVDGKERDHIQRVKIAQLERATKELREEKEALAQQVVAAEDAQTYDREKTREVRRLEGELGRLREREDAIEADLLAAQNQVLRLRFEGEAAVLKLQRWQRRVRELESLPLAVGRADRVGGGGAKRGGKEEDEMERFVRSTKVAMEKLHRENENLRANSSSNVKYMDVVREAKNLKVALGERDREIALLSEKLSGYKEAADRKSKVDEKNRSLERQLKAEKEKSDEVTERLRERDRQVTRLESDLRAARESRGGAGADSATDALAEVDALTRKLRAAERDRVSLEAQVKELERDLRGAERKIEDLTAQIAQEQRRLPSGAAEGKGDSGEARKLRDMVKKLQEENEDLRAELNSFDPAFFDEIEDLKYNHNEMVKLVDRYETLLQHLSAKYGFDFTPQTAASRRSRA